MKIIHVITTLGDGGAENTLYKICKYDNVNNHIVISLKKPEKYFFLMKKLGIKVYCLNIKFYNIIFCFINLLKLMKVLKPDIVQTWLIHGDFIGGFAARISGIKNVIWNVRYSDLRYKKSKILSIILIKILSKLSHTIPRAIVVVSKSAKKNCINLGYCKKKLILIQNGYDLSILKPIKSEKNFIRKKFKVKKTTPLIGMVARYDFKKDHSTLLKSLSILHLKKRLVFFCIFVGTNINKSNKRLLSEIKELKLNSCVKLLGRYDNIPRIMSGLNLYVQSSSYGEGFPNVVAEAMACGVPCVVTNVGDAKIIVGNTGWVVNPEDPLALANSIKKAISRYNSVDWIKRSRQVRMRIKKNFNVSKMIRSYNKTWAKVAKEN